MRINLPAIPGRKREARETPDVLEPNASSEADRIEEEVSRRKKRAEESGIRECVMELYYGSLRCYDVWIHNSPESVYPGISGFEYVPRQGVKFTLGTRHYEFHYEEKSQTAFDGEVYRAGMYNVLCDNQRVLKFRVTISCPEEWYDETHRSAGAIEAFIDGPWVEELKNLGAAVKRHEAAARLTQERKAREDPARLEDLKKRFGI